MIRKLVHIVPARPHAPEKLHELRRVSRIQRTATVVADHLDPATFLILLLDPIAVIVGAGLVFVAFGILGIFLLARLVRLDEERDERLLRAAARKCVECLRNISTAVLLKIEQSGKTKDGISAERATRELDRRDPRHP